MTILDFGAVHKNVKLNNYEQLSTVHTVSLFYFFSYSLDNFVLSAPVEFVYEMS